MKAKKKAAVIALSEAEKKAIRMAAIAVWQYVGYDYLAATAEAEEKSIDAVALKRAEVIEVVTDAGRLEDQLKADAKAAARVQKDLAAIDFDALVAKVATLDYETMKKVLRPAFVYDRYGT